MILLHAQVLEPTPDEEDAFEGHAVCVIAPRLSDDDRDLLRRFTESATEKEE